MNGGGRKVASSLRCFLLKCAPWKASKTSKGLSLPCLLQRAPLVVGATGQLPSGFLVPRTGVRGDESTRNVHAGKGLAQSTPGL